MPTLSWASDALHTIDRLQAQSDKLAAAVQALLDLHVAHHNEPIHAAARELLRVVAEAA